MASNSQMLRAAIIMLFVAFASLTVFGSIFTYSNRRDHPRDEFGLTVDLIMEHVSKTTATTLKQVKAIKSFYDASEYVTLEEFTIFEQDEYESY